MSTYTPYTWPVIDTAAVCALQDLASSGSLLLNGTFTSSDTPNQISFISNNFIRSISITSANNLSGVTFTVTGFQNEAFVTETITGPNNDTVSGTKYYDVITSVIVNGAVTQVSVGTGTAGYLPLVQLNTLSSSINYSCSIKVPASGSGVTYSLYQTLEQVSPNYITFQNQIGSNFFQIGTDGTTSQILNFNVITNYLLFKIVSTAPTTDTVKFIYLQL